MAGRAAQCPWRKEWSLSETIVMRRDKRLADMKMPISI